MLNLEIQTSERNSDVACLRNSDVARLFYYYSDVARLNKKNIDIVLIVGGG